VALLSPLGPQFLKNDGTVAALCKLWTYASGTTTPVTSYQDQAGTIPHTNPIILDSAGKVQPELWLTSGTEYRLRLLTESDVLIDEWDDIYGAGDASFADFANTTDVSKGDALIGVKRTATGSVATTQHARTEAEPLNVKGDLGAACDGTTDDTAALANATTAAGLFTIPSKSAYQYGSLGPAFGARNRVDVATVGSTEKLTNGTFTGSATGWTLSNFTYSANAIAHTAGAVGSATQSVTLSAYRHYLLSITLTTTTRGGVDLQFGGVTMLDDTGYYVCDVGTNTFSFPHLSGTGGAGTFGVVTDTVWAGSIDSVSVIEVSDELPLSTLVVPTDDAGMRIPYGLKWGRFNAGVIAIGDRQTMALPSASATWNLAMGPRSLQGNIDGIENTAVGAFAGRYTTTSRNTFYGYAAGKYNTLGDQLTALGYKSLSANTVGVRNTGVGYHSGMQSTAGSDNTLGGWQAGYNILTTSGNTVWGSQAGMNGRGSQNTYVGALAGYLNANVNITYTYSFGTMVGSQAVVYGENGTAIGFNASVGADGAPKNNAMALGANATTKLANSAKIGSGHGDTNLSGRLYYKNPQGSDNTAGSSTISIGNFMSAVFTRTGPAGPFNDTTPTAAAIVAAIPGCEAGSGYDWYYRNTSGSTMTLVAGSGVTLSGTTTVATNQCRLYKIIATNVGAGTEAVTVVGISTAAL